MRFDDSRADREPYSGSDADGLGREVGLEDAHPHVGCDPGSVVGDGNPGAAGACIEPRCHPNVARQRTLLQGLLRVDDQIEQHLVQLIGVGEECRDVFRQLGGHVDAARAHGITGELERRQHHLVEIDRSGLGRLLPRHGKEGAHDARAPFRRLADAYGRRMRSLIPAFAPCAGTSARTSRSGGVLSPARTRGGGRGGGRSGVVCTRRFRVFLLQHHRAGDHHRQRIVELVCDPGEQRSERGKLLALVQSVALARELGGRLFPVGDVARNGEHVRFTLILHRHGMHLELER